MKIETEKEYDEVLVFLDAFFEDPDSYSKEDGIKVKEMMAAVIEYENTHPPKSPEKINF